MRPRTPPSPRPVRPRRHALAGLLLLAVLVACVQGARAPQVAPGGTLSLTDPSGASGDSGPFRVLHASPQGVLGGPSEITVLFSRPMRSLELAGDEAPFPARIDPPVDGRWQWVGTRAATFVPQRAEGGGSFRLPQATRYAVTIPAGTRSADGQTLAEDFRFSFETERPALVRTRPWNNQRGLRPDATFEAFFSAPIADAEVARAVSLRAAGKPVPVDVRRPDPRDPQRVQLVPRSALPLDAEVELLVADDLRTTEGPLPSGKAHRSTFRTYGPLVVDDVTCNRSTPNQLCSATDGIHVSFSNRVRLRDLKRALHVSPPVKLSWPSWASDEDSLESIQLYGRFLPGATHRLEVRGPLVDEHGQTLARPHTEAIRFDDLWPTARIGMSSGVVEASVRSEITVASMNAADLEIATLPVSEDDVLAFENGGIPAFGALAGRPGHRLLRGTVGPRNVVARDKLKLADVLGGPRVRGAFLVATRHTRKTSRGPSEQTDRALGQLTDLAISAKVSKHGSVVWVSRLGDAQPVAGATVKIRRPGERGATRATDPSGLAAFTPEEFTPRFEDEKAIIFVETPDDRAYAPVSENVDNWEFQPGEDGPFGMIFDERGIYRPGDVVRLKGIVREPTATGMRTPSPRAARVIVDGPDGEPLVQRDVTLSAFGTFSLEARLPASSRLGHHEVRATVDGEQVASASFELAEFRPSEFEVAAESDRSTYVRGDKARWTARGDYLFGAPMADAQVELVVSRSRTWFRPADTDGFETGDEDYRRDLPDTTPRADVVAHHEVRLDPRGQATTGASLTLPGQTGPESVTLHADVTDLSRQVLSASTTAIVHPAEHYVGVALDDTFVEKGTTLSPRFVAARPDGKRVVGAALDVTLYRRSWVVARAAQGVDSASTVTTPVDTALGTCRLVSQASPVSCTLKPTEPGYHVLRVTSQDARRNPVAASIGVYVTGEGGSSGWAMSDSSDVELIPDKETYRVGDVATILVKSPFRTAEAIVGVERAKIHDRRRTTISGAAPTIRVPITEEMRPNAFVSVLLTRGRSQKAPNKLDAADVGAPAFRLGYVNLRVDPETKRLSVAVKPGKKELGPGDEIAVALDVKDAAGKPARAEVTLYAVDEGVLSLTGYKTPDPIPVFGAPRPLRVATLETRARLASIFDPLSGVGLDKGLDGGGGGESEPGGSARRDFRASAYFNPAVVTGDDGHAEVRFKLPDNLTTWRVMAVAVSDDRFGFGQERVTTSRPLMARPALPRFLRAGDTFDASLVVSTKGLQKTPIDVTASGSGAVTLSGELHKRLELEPGRSSEVRFAASTPRTGEATFRFDLVGGSAKDAVVLTRPVRSPAVLESVALDGSTSTASAEALGDLSAIRDDVGGLTVTTASTALVGLDAGGAQLFDYPYGCTEQLTSKLVPMLPMRELAKDFGIQLPPNVDRVVESTVAKILTHQRADGSFGFWADSPTSNAWVTAYALWGLSEAKKRGVAVPQASLDQAAHWLFRSLEQTDPTLRLGAAPMTVYVLATIGKPDPGRVSLLFEARDQLPLFGKALLLSAMVVGKHDPASIQTLVAELESSVRLDGPVARAAENRGDAYAVFLDSETRTTALVLRALLAAKPDHPLASKLAMGLLRDRDGGAWRSTQETAWALLALADYRVAQEKVTPNFVAGIFFGETLLDSVSFQGRDLATRSTVIPAGEIVGASRTPLSFSVDGQGKLFYQARLRYARRELPKEALDRGFFVERRYRKVTTEGLGGALDTVPTEGETSFVGGDLVLADVVLVNPTPRRFVVVDDPLPAGFEAVDTRLATTSARLSVDGGEDREGEGYAYATREIRDDRVLFFVDHLPAGVFRWRYLARATALGTFVLPATRAEEMYAPEIFGRSAAGVIRVGARP